MRLGRQHEAAAHLEEAVDLTRDVKDGEFIRPFHALNKARLGDLSALGLLENEVRAVLRGGGAGFDSPTPYTYYMLYYDAACIHAALAKLALQDHGKTRVERQRLADRDIARALELLDKARAASEFKGAIRLDEIRRETLLDPLRSHPRFQLLMLDVTFPDDPFTR